MTHPTAAASPSQVDSSASWSSTLDAAPSTPDLVDQLDFDLDAFDTFGGVEVWA